MNETIYYDRPRKLPSVFGRFLMAAAWMLPTACLALMPKCPSLLAVCVGKFTGLQFSVAAATSLRLGLLVACLSWLSYLMVRSLVRFVFEPSANDRRSCATGFRWG